MIAPASLEISLRSRIYVLATCIESDAHPGLAFWVDGKSVLPARREGANALGETGARHNHVTECCR